MSLLRIYFSSRWQDSESACPWSLCDDSGAVISSGEAALSGMPRASECLAVIAAECLLSARVAVPAAPRRRWANALPLIAEDLTLPDPEENHVVPGAQTGDQLNLYIVNKAWLRRIKNACQEAGLALRKAVPEIALPQLAPDAWALVWNGHGGFVCTQNMQGMTLDRGDPHTAPLALQLLIERSQPAPQKIELRFAYNLEPEQKTLPQWANLPALQQGTDWDWRSAPIPAGTPNLLWGELAPPLRPLEWWPKLRPAAVLLLAVVIVQILGTNLQWAMLAYERNALNQRMVQSFRQAFGNTAVVVNAPLQMQRNLASLRHDAGIEDDGDFLPMLGNAARLLTGMPAGTVQEIHYENGRMDVTLKLGSMAEANALQTRLQSLGFNAHMDASDSGNGVNAKLTLQQGTAS